ncbi:DUF333 domain-containing protein [Kingella negevensis]|uniref:Hemolysin n=1 Tax=Kingella negevensis TaxID=1522312 RepID=A0A238T9D4_9NEIS|nr:DUF333 domain-containing protein [Kingella negevensis]MDK4681315.1 DUF333 domain-containing protein [Kingella negevensis]MDK4683512.1 DUF333 domain-containing protein [Kingella negevensis]MDK4684043.1 DUF333 domain-containing protein [Kingella negevensis]MDK4691353.1 DUF333 domain-containing protein [Kingella negevensis]MDK4693498.1 DUF333 domain-containing protein [Kingella negevensis]
MKKTLATLTAAAALSACASQTSAVEQKQIEPAVGMANPASVYCVEQGGKLEVRKDKDGNEYGMCHLPNGKVAEEWEFFRANNKYN